MRESAIAWSWFDVVVPKNLPAKQHPDVQCRQCRLVLKNAQLGRNILPHAGYNCEGATTDMLDTARRLIYKATVRKADRGDKKAQLQLTLGEAGEPNWRKRNMRLHPWIDGYPSSDEECLDDVKPPAKKKQRVTKKGVAAKAPAAAAATAAKKPLTSVSSNKKKAAPATPKKKTLTDQQEQEFTFSAQAMDNESGVSGGFMVAEAFHALGVPLATIDNPMFRSILKILNPNVSLPPREELENVLASRAQAPATL